MRTYIEYTFVHAKYSNILKFNNDMYFHTQ